VNYGWSSWLSFNSPVQARYVRFNWDGNNDALHEVQLGFARPAGSAPTLSPLAVSGDLNVGFAFTNTPGAIFTVLTTTNLAIPKRDWTMLGAPAETAPGYFEFTDLLSTNYPFRFYDVRTP
jgi:hypothetical protein